MKKITKIIIAVILIIMAAIIVKLYDDRDYYMHQSYALEHNCEWEWDEMGNWTVCR